MQEIGLEKAVAIIASSEPLASVYRHLIDGDFIVAPEEVGENEAVIGELTDFEKAVLTARTEIAGEADKMEGFVKFSMELSSDALNRLLWASIISRLGEDSVRGTIGIRGPKIVSVKVDNRCACAICDDLATLLVLAILAEEEDQ